jgi:sulfotransferase
VSVSEQRPRGPRYAVHDGFRMPMGFPIEGFASGQRYRPGPADIFVATYPKCGTTWTQYMVYLLLHGGQPLPADRNINDVFPHLEEVGEAVVRALPQPRLIKTHLPFERTPWSAEAKYVYVARNPFDCAVSFYHHTRGFPRHYDFAEGTWDTFFECFLSGEVDFGDYFDHLLSWWPMRTAPNVLLLTYERMLAGPESAAHTIATFLGGAAAAAASEPRLVERVVEHSSFDSMRTNQRRWSSARPADMPEFVRKGVVGDWANYFSVEQARRLAQKLLARARGTGAESLWPEHVEAALGQDPEVAR